MAELIDELGFDWVSLTEHHYSPRLMSPNPMVVAAAMSQRTKRAKIALLGPILPLLNPVRVAEEYATLDNLCSGRLIAGFLRGIPNEFQTYGVNPAESRALLEEGLELILRAWTEPQPFGWEGRHYRFRNISIWPRPVQQPYPPLYMSGKAPESGTFAARHQIGMSLSFNSLEECLDSVGFYCAEAARFGWEPGPEQVLYRGYCLVADNDEEARQQAEEHGFGKLFVPIVAGPRARAMFGNTDGDLVGARLREGQTIAPSLTLTLDRPPVWEGKPMVGSPETVMEQLRYARETAGIGVMDLIFHGLPHEAMLRSLRLFASEVLPKVREF
jgi:alkanesulfonate monooxygenase SsuD/methylene tetrahydromethanopterin reductase-like flavin-dependent oxidoreductase (luciferase family)